MTTIDRLTGGLRPDGAPDTPTVEGWSVTDLGAASWASRKAAAARHQIAKVTAWAAAEKARIDSVAAAETARFERDAEFFEEHLANFLRAEIAAGRKTKSLSLPGGTIKLTARQPRVDVDESQFLEWARQAGRADLVRVKESVDKAALKQAAELAEDGVVVIDGEIVPATWEAQEDSATFTATESTGGDDEPL